MAQLAKFEGYEAFVSQLLASVPRSKLPGVMAKLPAKVLAALPAEKVMAGRSVRERLAGLTPAELEALRAELLGAQPAKAKPKRRRAKASR
jgi:hypothetical protein